MGAGVRGGPTFLSSLVLASLWVPPGVAAAVIVIQPARPGCREDGMGRRHSGSGSLPFLMGSLLLVAPLLYL